MEESGVDVVGDEEVEGRDKRVTVGAEAGNLVWDPRTHYLSSTMRILA